MKDKNIYQIDEEDVEEILVFFMNNSIVFAGSLKDGDTCIGTQLYLLINDYFGPGSDAESLLYSDIIPLFKEYKEEGWKAIPKYVAKQRKIENIYWKNKLNRDGKL